MAPKIRRVPVNACPQRAMCCTITGTTEGRVPSVTQEQSRAHTPGTPQNDAVCRLLAARDRLPSSGGPRQASRRPARPRSPGAHGLVVERLAQHCGVLGAPGGCCAPCGLLAATIGILEKGNKSTAHEGKLNSILGFTGILLGID